MAGRLTVLQYRSMIEREQLGPHLRKLCEANFLASYAITEAPWRRLRHHVPAGRRIFHDYDRFYRGRHQGEMQFEFHNDREDVVEPLKVAYLFIEKRTGQPISVGALRVLQGSADRSSELLPNQVRGHAEFPRIYAYRRQKRPASRSSPSAG